MSLAATTFCRSNYRSPSVAHARLFRAGLSLSSLLLDLRTGAAQPRTPFRVGAPQPRGWLGEPGFDPTSVAVVETPARGELFFIDGAVADPNAFYLAAPAGATVVCLPAGVEPWQFMAGQAANFRNLRAIHIISHGEPGALTLNGRRYAARDLDSRPATLRDLGRALSKNGDILLYGCDTGAGAEGAKLVTTLAEFTGADVAASVNLTGGVAKADWNLEIAHGEIETPVVAPGAYAYALVTTSVSTVAQLKSAIATGNTDNVDDTITITGNLTFASASDAIAINVTDGHKMTIEGGGFTLDANYYARALNISAGAVDIQNLVITHGAVSGNGGNKGVAVAGGFGSGGGISNAGTLTLRDVALTLNIATGGGGGGGNVGANVGGGGGGGSGAGGHGGGNGGSAGGYAAGAGGGGSGGYGAGYQTNLGYMGGRGGTSSGGGAGGIGYAGYSNGGAGATATAGGVTVGGGGGGSGWDATGGAGGGAAGAIYNTGVLTILGTSAITNNIGAAGGGGGGGGGGNHGGLGGLGVGAIWNAGGTVQITAANYSSMAGNAASSGSIGGIVNSGSNSGFSSPASVAKIYNSGGTVDTNYVLPPSITSSAYDASTGVLAITAADMTAGDTIAVAKLTLTGEGGATYTLTSANVTASSATSFSVTLNGTDQSALNQIINKNGTSSTGGTTFNLAAADDWDASVTSGDTSDATNGVTASNVAVPTITSSTYDASTGALVVTGTGFTHLAGATNDIVANKFTLTGEGGNTYTLTDTSNVEITSGTSFTLSLSATDKAGINQFVNKNGTSSTSGTTFNVAAAEDWAAGADAAVVVADVTGNGITVSNVAVPMITSATYDASTGTLVVTGTGFLTVSGATNDIVANKFTLTGEGGATYTLTDSANVEITSGTSFTLTLSAADKAALDQILNKNGTSSTGATTFGIAAAEDWAAGADPAVTVADLTGNGITVSNVAVPTITSATYDANTGTLVVTGTGFLSSAGATNDIVANKFTLVGEGGATYTLTDSANVEITSGTSFTLTLSATDKAAVSLILNKNGTSSTGGTTFGIAAAEDWDAGAASAVVIADVTGNGVTASNVAVPTITSATYSASTGVLVVTGTGFTHLAGATNDIVANKFTLVGEGGATYTLTDSANVEIASGTSFTFTLSATDRAAVNLILNKNGTASTGGTTFGIAAAEDWAAGADAAVVVADLTGNGVTVSNVAVPTVTSATYDASTGILTVTGTGFLSAAGATNDIVANKFTLTGEGGATYTLTDTANMEITSGTSFTLTLSATDKAALDQILNKNGTSSTGATTFGLAAAEDWAAGADPAVTVADLTGNGITTSNVAVPSITSATYDASAGALVVKGTGFLSASGATNDIVANKFTLTGNGGATYTLTDTADVEITSGTAFTLTLSGVDKTAVNLILNKNGTSSADATTYNLAGAEDWAAGADASVVVADLTGNGITASNVDTTAPTVTSLSVPANGTYVVGDNLDFTVNFSEAVTVNTGGGTPRIALTLDTGGTVYADYISGSGTTALTFRYTVASGNLDTDGITIGALSANGGTLKDAAENDASLTLNSVGSTAGVLIDAIAPAVSSIDRAGSTTTHASSVDYTITFSESVTGVDTSDFTLTATGTAAGTIASMTGSGAVYTATVSSVTGNGTLRLDLNASGTAITDAAGNAIAGGFTAGQAYTIDTTGPSVSSIVRQSPATLHTTAPSVTYRVTFDGAVSGVDASAFSLASVTGNPAGTISSVTLVDAANYDVTVGSLAGVGALRLDVKAGGTSIVDTALNPLSSGFTRGDVFFIGATGVFDATAVTAPNSAVVSAQAGDRLAQRFTTASTAPLTLTDVAVRISAVTNGPQPVVTINRDSGGAIGSVVTTLTNPVSLTANATNLWTGSATLDGATTYWIVFSDASATGSYIVNYASAATTGGSGAWLTAGDYLYQYSGASAGVVPLEIGATTAAAITSLSGPSDGNYQYGQNLDFAVTFANAVTVTGSPSLGFTAGATPREAGYLSGSGTDVLIFRYAVQAADVDTDGIVLDGVLRLNGGTIEDDNTIPAALSFTPPSTAGIRLSTAAPAITSATTAVATYGSAFDYTIAASSSTPVTSYSATGLPTGLTLAPSTGVISGTPSQTGEFAVTLGATSAAGAGSATLNVSVAKAAATVSLGLLDQTYDAGAKTVSVTTIPSGLTVAVTYDGSPTAPVDAGTYAIAATIADANYVGAVSGTLVVAQADQTIVFAPIGAAPIGQPVALDATASSGLPVSFSLVSGNAQLVGSNLTALDSDPVTVRATQAGNINYRGATGDQTVRQEIKQSQTITFAALSNQIATAGAFELHATASSGLPVDFSLVSGPVTLSGATVSLTGASGRVTLRASQGGNAIYSAAADVTQSFTVNAVGPQVFFGSIVGASMRASAVREAGRVGSAASSSDPIAVSIDQDNRHGTLIGYLGGSNSGFAVAFDLADDGSFSAPATTFSSNPATSRVLTFSGQVANGVINGTIVELGATFYATIDPPGGATAGIAGYYVAPATNTATGSIYVVVGTEGRVFVVGVTPEWLTSGTGTATSAGAITVTTTTVSLLAAQIDPATATISGTLTTTDNAIVEFNGVRSSTNPTDRLVNLSARGAVSPTERLIAGFVIGGAESKEVLLRAVGPGLSSFGLGHALADPKLQLFNQQGQVILENDDWSGSDVAQAANHTGAFSLLSGSHDAALVATLRPGVYTMHVSSGDGSSGLALAEIYDAGENTTPVAERLINISSRAVVGNGDNVLISGFVVLGNSPKRLLIRGVGPSLLQQAVPVVVADPMLRVYDHTQTVVANNNDWETPLTVTEGQTSATGTEIADGGAQVGAFALNAGSKDAAVIVTVSPGIYTVVLSDNTSAGGTALVEIYELP